MSQIYITRDGDMLDSIAYRAYGKEDAVHNLIAANPLLSRQPAILPAGIVITLPDISPLPAGTTRTVRLWSGA